MAQQKDITLEYSGTYRPLLKISIVTTLLTLITIGFYRFWARTRVRKYMWSAISLNDAPLEYTGKGLEKFLGFLIAVAVLAVYLGILQVLLTFVGLSLFPQGDSVQDQLAGLASSYIALFALLPLIFYAQYRARRYILSRTRLRGIRFGADKAAWGYVLLALKNLFLVIITLGILLPRMTFNLEKYRVDHSWYGDHKFTQNGEWKMLFPAMRQTYIGMAITAVSLVMMGVSGYALSQNPTGPGGGTLVSGAIVLSLGYTWWLVGFWIYTVASWRIMANHKSLGDTIEFSSEVETSEVIIAQVIGWSVASIIAIIVAFFAALVVGFVVAFMPSAIIPSTMDPEMFGVISASVVGYLVLFLVTTMLVVVTVAQPILRNYVTSLTIVNAQDLDLVQQRGGDDFVEAEGFADALDVGAGI